MNVDARAMVAAVLSVALVAGLLLRGPLVHGASGMPTVMRDGRTSAESCLRCHSNTQGLDPAHAPEVLGCSLCHLGNPAALDAAGAHKEMVILTGDLRSVEKTCGRRGCHAEEARRVQRSVMAGSPGLLAVDRFAFQERDTPQGTGDDDLRRLDPMAAPTSPAESHVRKLCGSCHLAMPKTARGDLGFASRGGGCVACHLGPPNRVESANGGDGARLHPSVSAAVAESRCVGCHSRSGRIAMSFRGQVELEPGDPRVSGALPDGRPTGDAPRDVHADAGFTCIDCHTERGLMGDGQRYIHAYEAVDVSCNDCHGAELSLRAQPTGDRARVSAILRKAWHRRGMPQLSTGRPLTTGGSTALWRTDASTKQQLLADTGEATTIPIVSAKAYHTLRGHERLSCQACHTAWAPRCTKCHTRFDPNGKQVDHLSGVETAGRWEETAGGNGFGLPLLAVGPEGDIMPFVEGMILRIEGAGKPIDRRLFAPLDPHTTGRSRPCGSCHPKSGMRDTYPQEGETTRQGARLLSEAALGRISRVARCLGCHGAYEDPVYLDFPLSIQRLRRFRTGARPGVGTNDSMPRCGGRLD